MSTISSPVSMVQPDRMFRVGDLVRIKGDASPSTASLRIVLDVVSPERAIVCVVAGNFVYETFILGMHELLSRCEP